MGMNISHLARHRIRQCEIEEMFRADPPITGHEVVSGEDCWSAAGATKALRVLVVVFTRRRERIRTITGWDADRRTKNDFFKGRGG